MARKIRFLAASIAKIVLVAWVVAGAQTKTPAVQSGYAPVNGLWMYYEIHGTEHGTGQQPLVRGCHLWMAEERDN